MKYEKSFIVQSTIMLRRSVYALLGMMHRYIHFQRPDVVVFCYHSIGADSWRFTVSLDRLKHQIETLLTEADPLSISELEQYLDGSLILSRPGFVITFDDGYRDVLNAVDFFREKEIYPIVFVLSKPNAANRIEMENEKPLLNVQELRSLRENGWTIGCHSATHASFEELDSDSMKQEISSAKHELEIALGIPVEYFAYPKGRYTDKTIETVRRAGFKLGFTVEYSPINVSTEKFLIPRVGVDQTHTLSEFLVMSTKIGILFKENVAKIIGRFL